MEYKNIIFEKRDGIGYVTMNRERALNALNTEVLTELDHVFCAIDQDEEVKSRSSQARDERLSLVQILVRWRSFRAQKGEI